MKPVPAKYAEVPALWAQGLMIQEIADRIGLSYSAVNAFMYQNRELCPKRGNLKADLRDGVVGTPSLAKRTILVPVVPITGITQAPVSYTPVSVAAFSWDAQA